MDKTYSIIVKNYSQTENGRENLFLLIVQLTEESKNWQKAEVVSGLKKLSYLRTSINEALESENDQQIILYYKRLLKMIDNVIKNKEESVCQTA